MPPPATLAAPMTRSRISSLLREPLVHFLLLGAALFAVSAWRTGGEASAVPVPPLRIGEGEVRWLRETWTLQWQREPTPEELRALVAEYVKEELLSREAREMGLDRDDTYVRRRLAQKVEFLLQDTTRLAEPTEEELRRLFAAHPEWFGGETLVSFTQVYFSPEHRAEATATLPRLLAGANPMDQGDMLLVDAEIRAATRQAVAAQFGPKFAEAVLALEGDAWQGPIESGYGLHLVRVTERRAAKPRELAEVRAQVVERWRDERHREASQAHLASLYRKYGVVADESVRPMLPQLGPPGGAR